MFVDQLDKKKECHKGDPISWRRRDHTSLHPTSSSIQKESLLGWLDEKRAAGIDGGNFKKSHPFHSLLSSSNMTSPHLLADGVDFFRTAIQVGETMISSDLQSINVPLDTVDIKTNLKVAHKLPEGLA